MLAERLKELYQEINLFESAMACEQMVDESKTLGEVLEEMAEIKKEYGDDEIIMEKVTEVIAIIIRFAMARV